MGMEENSQVATTAGLFADPTRAGIILALAESGPRTVSDLAATVGVSIPTASTHLTKHALGGLVAWDRVGRLHIYRLAGTRVTNALEALIEAGRSIRSPQRVNARVAQPRPDQLARTCYDHLAGRLGVGVTDALLQGRLISNRSWSHRATKAGGYGVTKRGREFFREIGVNLTALRTPTRAFAHPCLDRTERRAHMGGALGAALARRLEDLGWIVRLPRTRVVRITGAGRTALRSRFGLEL